MAEGVYIGRAKTEDPQKRSSSQLEHVSLERLRYIGVYVLQRQVSGTAGCLVVIGLNHV